MGLSAEYATFNGRRVVFGIRPEDIVFSEQGAPAQVVVIEPTGSETQITLRAGTTDISVVCRERIAVRPGDSLHL